MTHDDGEINQDSSQDQSNMIKDRLPYLRFCDADASEIVRKDRQPQ
jgi:hypothetical protein